MRFVHTADIHIGEYRNGPTLANQVNGRFMDIHDRIEELLNYLVKNDIKHLFIAGDIFKDKFPVPSHLREFATVLQRCAHQDINVWIIPGNHDRAKASDQMHHLGIYMPILPPQVRIIDAPSVIKIEGIRFYFFPYIKSPQQPNLMEFLGDSTSEDVLVMHGIVEGCKSGLFEYEINDDDIINMSVVRHLKMVLAGDVHTMQHFDNVYYPGSLERLTFNDEGETKGFWDIIIGGEIKFVPVNARRMVTVHADDIKPGVDVKDAIVRIKGIKAEDVADAKKILNNAGCYYVANIRLAEKKEIEGVHQITVSIPDLIRQHAQKVGYTGDIDSAIKTIMETLNAT